VDYLTRLEQGRGRSPSESVLGALARALRLTTAERDHLFALGGVRSPGPGTISSEPRPSMLRLMDRLTDLPAMLVDARMDVIAWNAMAVALLGDFSAPAHRNIAWRSFTGPGSRIHTSDDAERERLDRALVADLRAASGRYPDDPGMTALVTSLRRRSARFAALWAERAVAVRHDDRKCFDHPAVGLLELDCDALHDTADDQVLLVYSAAPGSSAAEALALLRVIGVQPDITGSAARDRHPIM
jgi:hypothetical protein